MTRQSMDYGSRYRQVNDFHAERPFTTKPKTTGETKVDGKNYYTGENGKLYQKDLFDRMFNAPGGVVKKKPGRKGQGVILNQY